MKAAMNLFGRIILLIAILSGSNSIYAEENGKSNDKPKSETSGPGISAGYGYEYSCLGVQICHYSRLSGFFSIVPYLAIGYYPNDIEGQLGFSTGCLFAFGYRHRFIVDLNYGLAGIEYYEYSGGYLAHVESLYGITGAAGYEFLSNKGVFFRIALGATHIVKDPYLIDSLTLTIGFGYKFF